MKKISLLLSSFLFLLMSCAPQAIATQPAAPQTLTLLVHDSFAVSKDVVKSFEQANNARVVFLKSGDAGAVLNKAILTKNAPLADLLYGIDNTFLSRALEANIYDPYVSPVLKNISNEFRLDTSNHELPVDYADVCINYDTVYFTQKDLPVPQTLDDLTKPAYKNMLVVENPATSSTGLAFMLATVAHYGDSFTDYWHALKENGVVVVDGWETAYYTNFSGSSGKGPQPMVVSYDTSPAAETHTASILGPDTCFRQIEFVGILKGTQHRALAEKFVDFMLSQQFQEDMPTQMYVYPVNPSATLPAEFIKSAQTPKQPATLAPDVIAAKRDAWIQAWTDVVMK